VTDISKRSTLIHCGINYARKKFYDIAPGNFLSEIKFNHSKQERLSKIYTGTFGTYLSEAHVRVYTLKWKYYTRAEVTGSEIQLSLLKQEINYIRKKFCCTCPDWKRNSNVKRTSLLNQPLLSKRFYKIVNRTTKPSLKIRHQCNKYFFLCKWRSRRTG
jgi:hypothetical protein